MKKLAECIAKLSDVVEQLKSEYLDEESVEGEVESDESAPDPESFMKEDLDVNEVPSEDEEEYSESAPEEKAEEEVKPKVKTILRKGMFGAK